MIETIETDRLIMIPYTLEQMEFAVLNPELAASSIGAVFTEFGNDDHGISSEKRVYQQRAQLIKNDPEKWMYSTMWQIILKETFEIVGEFGCKGIQPDGESEIGYSVREKFRRVGIMTEALNAFVDYVTQRGEIMKISAYTEGFNAASIRVLRKTGFQYCGEKYSYGYWIKSICE